MRSPPDGAVRGRTVRGWRTRTKLAVTLAAFALGSFLAEGAVRVLGLEPLALPVSTGRVLLRVEDPILLFVNQPGGHRTVEYSVRRGPPRRIEQSVNAQGFRGPEVLQPKPPEVLRIACVGDSHTFGEGVDEDGTWPVQLQSLLSAALPGRRIDVMNCGVNGYDTMQELLWLREYVLPYEPDLVLLQYYVNDTAARGLVAPVAPARDMVFELTHPRRAGAIGWLRARSHAVDFVLDGIHRRRALGVYSRMRLAGYRDDHPGWLRVQQGLRAMRDELAQRGIGCAVVLYPFLVREGRQLTSHEAFAIVQAFCAAEGIRCLDVEPAFLATDVDALRTHPQDYHANSEGNRIFARAVGEWLLDEELVR